MSISKSAKSKQSNQSSTLTPEQRQQQWNMSMDLFQQAAPGSFNNNGELAVQGYQAPEARTLGEGDYQALQDSIYKGRTAGIDEAVARRNRDINQEMSDRGMWASGAPIQQQQDEFRDTFAPMYAGASADATTARYGAQQADNQAVNSMALTNAAAQEQSNWRPLDYMQGLWNSTQGQTSSGNSSAGGWNYGFQI